MDVPRIRTMVEAADADAWVVCAGSREVLEWFCSQPTPAFAFAGRMEGLPMAGTKPDKVPAYVDVARQLVDLGHNRICLLAQSARRLPEPGRTELAFLDELESLGIQTGDYNLPNWEDGIEGFHQVLDSLFGVTAPTALILDEAHLYIAAQQFLLNRGIRVPQDVSLVCTDGDPNFAWCEPSIAHIDWDRSLIVRRIVRWANNVARGKDDLSQTPIPAEFISGGTVGPASL
jgi:DNA-binding LacI/PurR family transcriptional regulator